MEFATRIAFGISILNLTGLTSDLRVLKVTHIPFELLRSYL